MRNVQGLTSRIALALSPVPSLTGEMGGRNDHSFRSASSTSSSSCHGFWRDAVLAVPSALFVLYISFQAKKNLKKLSQGRSYTMIAYYALLWLAALLNLAWCSLQCAPGKNVAWNMLSLFTTAVMLCLEISLMAFLLQENYATGLEKLARTFILSGLIVGIDALVKVVFVFGFSVPLFVATNETTHGVKWGLWTLNKLLLTAVYGFILFVNYSKSEDKLPPRPEFYNYALVMFGTHAVALFACGLVGVASSFGLWLYNFTVVCYHSFYLPFLYITFLVDFFQKEDLLLDNAYYSEMRDAGFFDDADWD
ncbi:protein CANDIDATE G-PROTEIN COUPLED RECEPTOR 2-like isoform X2 [Diospyros lotus]|uniref:protein CANDIDATE G-PROTEIN COUPLED RECEPTOR 2-like isoform X2 n=1 Tax=Diospyros lotus TaxID=55363 RepID=UPI0022532F0F|nr:protein CANDIDATE G-PROTEIN COUPLED RECEPTOR 2-like isoform X2 [Diospyros lotus]